MDLGSWLTSIPSVHSKSAVDLAYSAHLKAAYPNSTYEESLPGAKSSTVLGEYERPEIDIVGHQELEGVMAGYPELSNGTCGTRVDVLEVESESEISGVHLESLDHDALVDRLRVSESV